MFGVSCDPSEAEIHWRAFLDSLIDRGLRGVRFVISDDHAGLKAARRAVLPGAIWQRCQFHLAQNAVHHVPNAAICKRIGAELRRIWNASSLRTAQQVEELPEAVIGQEGDAYRRLPFQIFIDPRGAALRALEKNAGLPAEGIARWIMARRSQARADRAAGGGAAGGSHRALSSSGAENLHKRC